MGIEDRLLAFVINRAARIAGNNMPPKKEADQMMAGLQRRGQGRKR
jgi:hypothetical protein